MAMTSKEAVQVISEHRDGCIVVSTMTAMKWLDQISPDPLNISSVPMMGGASALGLGLALARPERKVLILDGDGSLLMQLGSLATVVDAQPKNLHHFVFDNGVWFEGGGNLPVPARGRLDFATMARGAGYANVSTQGSQHDLRKAMRGILSTDGPTFTHLRIAGDTNQWSAARPPAGFPDSQFVRMGEEARRVREHLLAVR